MAFNVRWYLALIDNENEAFNAAVHNRNDTELLGFTFQHSEGQFATLQVITRNPLGEGGTFALGLLGVDRPQWCWFSQSVNGGAAAPLMKGRIVAVPTDVFGAKVTIDFQARPSNFVEQKRAIAASIKAEGPPRWCPEFYDEQQREDPELVLESMSAVWYVDPVTHVVSLSDILEGVGDPLVFEQGQHRMDSLRLSLGSAPSPAVDVDIEFAWTQRATGTAELAIASTSYTLDADSYPKAGASFGDGWTVITANVSQPYSFETRTVQSGSDITIQWWDGDKTSLKTQNSDDRVDGPGERLPTILTNYNSNSSYSEGELTSWSTSSEWSDGLVPLYSVSALYLVGYDAARPFKEHVTYTLRSDVQPTIMQPEDAEGPRLEFKSVDLSELIDGTAPIGDPRSRSFVVQSRGYSSVFYTLLCARAKLRRDARAVNITFGPYLDRLAELRLDKMAEVVDWRIPGGSAEGKVTDFTARLTPPTDKSGASFSLDVTIGSAVGRGGEMIDAVGEPDYVDDDYIDPSEEYQERTGNIIVFDSSVGFTVPLFNPSDDGLVFTAPLTDIFEVPLTYSTVAATEIAAIADKLNTHTGMVLPTTLPPPAGYDTWPEAMQAAVTTRNEAVKEALEAVKLKITFKLKDLKKEFTTDVELEVSDLKMPTNIDLEATTGP